MESKSLRNFSNQTTDPTNIMTHFILCSLEKFRFIYMINRMKNKTKRRWQIKGNLRIHRKSTDLINSDPQERRKDQPPCGAPRGVSRVEADRRRSGPCPDPWRRHQPLCPPAPSDQAPPRAPEPRSPKGKSNIFRKRILKFK